MMIRYHVKCESLIHTLKHTLMLTLDETKKRKIDCPLDLWKKEKKLDAIIEPTADYILSQIKLPTKLIHSFFPPISVYIAFPVDSSTFSSLQCY